LPSVITRGVAVRPASALALAETPPSPVADTSALLERAAELTAPLPPMPIANVAPAAARAAPPPASKRAGFVAQVATLLGVFSYAPDLNEFRGSQ